MDNNSIGSSHNSPVIQNPVNQQQMPKRRLAPQRPAGRSITVETDNIPSSNAPVNNKADLPKSAWTRVKVSDQSKARFGQEGGTQIGHRQLMQKQRAITEHAVKLAELQEIKKAHTEALSHLETMIAKTKKSAGRILLRSSSKQRLADELKTKEDAKLYHTNEIEKIDRQILIETAISGFNQSVNRSDKSKNPDEESAGGLFAKVQDRTINKPDGVTDAKWLTTISNAASDMWRSASKTIINDAREGLSKQLFSGRQAISTKDENDIKKSTGTAFISIISLLGQVGLRADDNQKLSTSLEGQEILHNTTASTLVKAAIDQGYLSKKFLKLLGACKQDLSNNIFPAIISTKFALSGTSPIAMVEQGKSPLKTFTYTLLPGGKLEIEINQEYIIQEKNKYDASGMNRIRLGDFQLTTTYTFDANMDLETIKTNVHDAHI